MSYEALHISEVAEVYEAGPDEPRWKAVRHHFGIAAFGVNGWVAQADGGPVIERHDEVGGHEELYAVLSGHARFTVDGEIVDAPAGTLVHVSRESIREAVGVTAGTTVLAIGATPGQPFEPTAWELRYTQKA